MLASGRLVRGCHRGSSWVHPAKQAGDMLHVGRVPSIWEKCLRSWNDGSPEDVYLRWGPQEEGSPCSCLRTWGEGGCINDALQLPVGFVMGTPEARGVPRRRRVALLRTGYGICGAQCKKNIQGPCSENDEEFQEGDSRVLKQS